jgi:transposase-like protein
MATATQPRTIKGFKVVCPFCGDPDATVSIDLNDLASCTCNSCSEDFSPKQAVAKLADQLKRWRAVERLGELAAVALAGEDPAEDLGL